MAIDTIRLSERAKNQLSTLKRRTGLTQWNVLCRWALCLSLAERSPPPAENIQADSNVEMTWKTFTGPYGDVYESLLRSRVWRDRGTIDEQEMRTQLLLHIHRGISYLMAKKDLDLAGLLGLTSDLRESAQGVRQG